MGNGTRIVAIVCIAVFVFTVVAGVPMFALFDAQTPIDALFWTPAAAPIPPVESLVLPEAPTADVRVPRAPPGS